MNAGDNSTKPVERRLIELSTGTLEVFVAGPVAPGVPIVCAAHPANVFGESAADDADPIVPLSHVRALHESIAGSKYLVVEGAGHVPTTARRSEVADAVRAFLRDGAR